MKILTFETSFEESITVLKQKIVTNISNEHIIKTSTN
jgi:hypothetical protein